MKTDAKTIGFWRWTWSKHSTPPAGADIGIAFSGWNHYQTGLQLSNAIHESLPGDKYFSIGGGDPKTGAFNSTNLSAFTEAMNAEVFSAYSGIAYDIEEGVSGLAPLFQRSFAAAKENGFRVLVTISHSAPYGIKDAPEMMRSFFSDANIDFLSPQLYTTGKETGNEYATTAGVHWEEYAKANAKIIPSIVRASLYDDAKSHFQQHGVELAGFIQWAQS